MKTAVIYARYSSERQTEQSIEGQLRVCYDFAKKNDLVIVDEYIDRATTGTNDNRAAFQRMLADSDKKSAWDVVLVYALDRFGRNSIDVAVNKQRLIKNGKVLISATQKTSTNIDGTQNLDGIILENVMIGLAEYYSAELSQKVKRGQNESRQKGLFCGGTVAYGYKAVNKKITVDEDTAEIVRKIFDDYAGGKIARDICDELNGQGITHYGKPFLPNAVYGILANEKYIGIYRHKNKEVFKNIYPPIVSEDVFQTVKARLQRNKVGSASRYTTFLLKGKLFCGVCGKKMNGESGTSHTGAMNYYYKCASKKRNTKNCSKCSIKKEVIEGEIVNVLTEIVGAPETIEFIAEKAMEIYKEKQSNQTVIQLLRTERNNTQKSLDNVLKAIEEGIFTKSTKDRLNELETAIAELDNKIQNEEIKEENRLKKEDVIEFIRHGIKQKPQVLIDTFIEKIILYDDAIDIYCKYSDKTDPDEPTTERRGFFLPIQSTLSAFVPPLTT